MTPGAFSRLVESDAQAECAALIAAARADGVSMTVECHPYHLELEGIARTTGTPKGAAQRHMQALCDLADRLKMPIHLEVYMYWQKPKLVAYYKKFGFKKWGVYDRAYLGMKRDPL